MEIFDDFILGDSWTTQLLSNSHEIYKFFDDSFEVRRIHLDISKTFEKVWRKELLYKITQNNISGKLFDIITNFLNFTKQSVLLNGQYSSWTILKPGHLSIM